MRLARDFSAIVLAARNESELQKTATAVRSAGAEPLVRALDLREPASAEILVKETLDRFCRIDALINIAGAVPQIDLFEMTDAQWDDGMALKLHGARRLTIRAWEALKASDGSVVLISGSAALDPKPGFAAVAAINAAIIALAKAFAEQGIKDGVQVNSVVPGAVMTGRRQSFREVGACTQSHSQRGDKEVSRGGGHQPPWQARRDRRPYGLSRIARSEVDDGYFGPHRWWRDQGRLEKLT